MTRRVILHPGLCEICSRPIEPGAEVYADDDTAAVHPDCLDYENRAEDHGRECDCQCRRCHDAGTCSRCDPDYWRD